MVSYKLEKAIDKFDLARRANQILASHIDIALDQRDRAQIALSGGTTPSATYKQLGQEHLPWNRVDVFLGDERWVDPNSDASNALMLKRTLFSSVPGSEACFHPVPTPPVCSSVEEGAESFSLLVEKTCVGNPPVFDLILLGLGDDGHTASLFPGSEAIKITDRWTTVCRAKGNDRISLTFPVLSSARKVVFLVSGSNKKLALQRLLDSSESSERTPARLVAPDSEVLVIADEEAAELV